MTDERDDMTQIEGQAAQWLVRINAPDVDEADIAGLTQWLEASDVHVAVFDRAERLWQQADALMPDSQARIIDLQAHAAKRMARSARPVWLIGAAAGMAAAVVAALVMIAQPKPAIIYATEAGEQRVLTLADGTRMHLNSGTRISVRLERDIRRFKLETGEVALQVIHDPKRPLSLVAGDQVISDIGTDFTVLRREGMVRITVAEGQVAVATASRPNEPGTPLVAGQQATHIEGRTGLSIAPADPAVVNAWQSGRAIYRGWQLRDVVNDLNRYMKKPLVVDARSGQLKVTAVMKLESDAAIVGELEAFLPVDAQEKPDRIELHYRP